MKMKRVLVLLAVLCAHPTRADAPTARHVRSKDIVDLLAGVSLVFEGPAKVGFRLRAFLYRTDGECSGDSTCSKDKLLVVAATFDEYPEKSVFEVPISGSYDALSIASIPKKESGSFLLLLRSKSMDGEALCASYAVTLHEMRLLPEPCPRQR